MRINNKIFSIKKMALMKIVSDAAIASSHIANGKTIPLIILDTVKHPEIDEMIKMHHGIKYGEVNSQWAKSIDNRQILLCIDILEPTTISFKIQFDIIANGGLIDIIVESQLLYLQGGKIGDRYRNTMNAPNILLEIPSNDFKNEWINIFNKAYTKHFRSLGMNKKDAKKAAKQMRIEWGVIRDMRMK